MSDTPENAAPDVVEDADAIAMAEMMAGYTNARAALAPADVAPADPDPVAPAPAAADASTQPADVADDSNADPAPEPAPVDEVAALKAQVKAIAADHDPDVVRKLYGAIGELNRKLTQPPPAPAPAAAPAPAVDETAAAIAAAEAASSEFPELTGPIVAALKAVASRGDGKPALSAEEISALVAQQSREAAQAARISAAQEALEEEHSDWRDVRAKPEFTAWLESKPADYQERLRNTWNPAVVAKGLTEFKDSLRVKQQKQNRLTQAVVPQGTPAPATPSTPTEQELILQGYRSAGPRPLHKSR